MMKASPGQAAARSCLLPSSHTLLTLVLCGLAFLPVIWHLARLTGPVANPLLAAGPVIAGFWLASTLCETRLNFAFAGVLLSVLVWLVNWFMLAGSDCCSMG